MRRPDTISSSYFHLATTSFAVMQIPSGDELKISLDELIAELSVDPEREPIASELGGASCLSPWKPEHRASHAAHARAVLDYGV